jgi:hypothetical protein
MLMGIRLFEENFELMSQYGATKYRRILKYSPFWGPNPHSIK